MAAYGAASVVLCSPAFAQGVDLTPTQKEKLAICAACHGPDGNSKDPLYPILAGQTFRYLYIELQDFKAGRRQDPVMQPLAATLEQPDMLALAQYYAAQKPVSTGYSGDPAKVANGKKISDNALCPMCHLGGFMGQNEIPRGAGQYYAYIKKQLLAFRAKTRTNDAGSMTSVMAGMSDSDIEDLSQYVASLSEGGPKPGKQRETTASLLSAAGLARVSLPFF